MWRWFKGSKETSSSPAGSKENEATQQVDEPSRNVGKIESMRLLVRGSERTGKSSLFRRLSGLPLSDEKLSEAKITWQVRQMRATVAFSVECEKPDAMLVLVDPRVRESVEHAKIEVQQCQERDLPVCVLVNFRDDLASSSVFAIRAELGLLDEAEAKTGGIVDVISVSLRDCFGLSELYQWLCVPLAQIRILRAQRDFSRIHGEFREFAANDDDNYAEHCKKIRRKQRQQQQQAAQANKSSEPQPMVEAAKTSKSKNTPRLYGFDVGALDDGFFSDDEVPVAAIPQRKTSAHLRGLDRRPGRMRVVAPAYSDIENTDSEHESEEDGEVIIETDLVVPQETPAVPITSARTPEPFVLSTEENDAFFDSEPEVSSKVGSLSNASDKLTSELVRPSSDIELSEDSDDEVFLL
ncbi:MAG: hypothetical protein MHM6MM_006942 [Cercozoa sp. M6MM]